MKDVLGMLDSGRDFLRVVKTLDDVERDLEWDQLGGLVDDVVGAVEDQVPEDRSHDKVERVVDGIQDRLPAGEGHEDRVRETDEHGGDPASLKIILINYQYAIRHENKNIGREVLSNTQNYLSNYSRRCLI